MSDDQMRVVRRLGMSPHERGCGTNENCPDVFELSTGDYAVMGEEATAALDAGLPADASRGPSERIVVIPRDVLLRAARDLPGV